MTNRFPFRIGEFEIEPATRRLRSRDGVVIHLASGPFQVLLDLIVYEHSLTRCLSSLRMQLPHST